jgi:hypothetical protein
VGTVVRSVAGWIYNYDVGGYGRWGEEGGGGVGAGPGTKLGRRRGERAVQFEILTGDVRCGKVEVDVADVVDDGR